MRDLIIDHSVSDNSLNQPSTLQDLSQPPGQYCAPNGACDFSNLDNGVSGFVLQGQVAVDFSGDSVSSAGDINGDGLADILIGAPNASPPGLTYAGKTYVVFGTNQTNVWGSGTVDLTSLMDGQHGFVLQGQATNDGSGRSVSSAGDINGDSLADILIGAASKTYVVFGTNQTNAWGSGTVDLTSLIDGKHGFVLQGATSSVGFSVSSVGDINGDGLVDILVGAPYANPSGLSSAGETYAVFGSNQTNAWGSGTVNLTNLINGQRGFVLQGQATNDKSGYSVSGAGDINGDGLADMLVGAPFASPSGLSQAGKTYVVFGSNQANAWGSGTVNLTNLINGQRGFVLQGQASGDNSGFSVSSASDINGDGLVDILVGAWSATGADPSELRAGKTYVVFGANQPNAWGSGTISLTSLMNGQRGFVLQGQANEESGYSVSSAGDINDDGLVDILVGAPFASPSGLSAAGKTYVVFGSNQTNAWGLGTVNLTSLVNGQSGFVLQGQALNDVSGWSVSSAGDINGDGLTDILVGAPLADPSGLVSAGKTYVVFGDNTLPILINNSLTIHFNETIQLTSAFLAAMIQNHDNSSLVFFPTSVSHGQFEITSNPGTPLTNFTQQQIWQGNVLFSHDGSTQPPNYTMSVSSGIMSTNSQLANITFINEIPPSAPDDSLNKFIIPAAIFGGTGFALCLFKLLMEYKLVPSYFEKTRGLGAASQNHYRQAVILPIAMHIYARVKFSSFLGYIDQQSINEYVDAVSFLVQKLEDLQVNTSTSIGDMEASDRLKFLESISTQTQKILVGEKKCFSTKMCKSFFKAETTSALLRTHAQQIAQAVRDELNPDARHESKDSLLAGRSSPATFASRESHTPSPQLAVPLLSADQDSERGMINS